IEMDGSTARIGMKMEDDIALEGSAWQFLAVDVARGPRIALIDIANERAVFFKVAELLLEVSGRAFYVVRKSANIAIFKQVDVAGDIDIIAIVAKPREAARIIVPSGSRPINDAGINASTEWKIAERMDLKGYAFCEAGHKLTGNCIAIGAVR